MTRKLLILVIFLLMSLSAIAEESVDTVWVRSYNGPGDSMDRALALTVDVSGNVYVTGYSFGSGTDLDYATIKYYPNGDTAWVRRYNGPGNGEDIAHDIAVDVLGNVYVTGESRGIGTSMDYTTIMYYPNGNVAWVRRYDRENRKDVASDLILDNYGNVYVTGFAVGYETGGDYVTIKYDSLGNELWLQRRNTSASKDDIAESIVLDGSNNIYVTGYSYYWDTNYDYLTIKYNPDGSQAWSRRYDGPVNNYDEATDIAVDNYGNIFVTGHSYGNTGMLSDYVTVKYDTLGNLLWDSRYNGPESGIDRTFAIAVDCCENVYVTGYSSGRSKTDYDYATIKYYPDGHSAWVRRYNGPVNSEDRARAIALDDYGNIYVTGYSDGGYPTYHDYTTIKYDRNGDSVWVIKYNGTGDGTDEPWAMAVDSSGYIYVTGSSVGNGTSDDYTTIKYHSVYSISGYVLDYIGRPLKDSLVFLTGDKTGVDTTDNHGRYEFGGLPKGHYKVYQDSTIGMYSIYLVSNTNGLNFREYTDVEDLIDQGKNPFVYSLSSNYPNPFNTQTAIEYTLSKIVKVELVVYNLLGQRIKTLVDEYQGRGLKRVYWDGKDSQGNEVSTGIYFYKLKAGDFTQTKKMVLLK